MSPFGSSTSVGIPARRASSSRTTARPVLPEPGHAGHDPVGRQVARADDDLVGAAPCRLPGRSRSRCGTSPCPPSARSLESGDARQLESRPRDRGTYRGAEHRRPAWARQGRRREAARRARRANRRAPVPPLRRGAPQRAARAPGARRLREGRRRAPRVRGREPDRGERHVVSCARRRRARARLPLADPPRAAAAGHDRRLQPLALRGRRRRPDVRDRARAGLAAALRAPPRLRADARRRGDDGAQGVPQRLTRRAARAASRSGSTIRASAGSSVATT